MFAVLLCCCGQPDAAVLVQSSNGSYVSKTDLATAATAADVAGKTVVVTTPQTLAANLSWPSDRELKFEKGGYIVQNAFNLSGLKYAMPQWFDAKADGTTDDTLAIQRAIDSVTNGIVRIPPASSSYRVLLNRITPTSAAFHKAALQMKSGVGIDATGAVIYALKNTDTHGAFASFQGVSDTFIKGGTWQGDKLLHSPLPSGEWAGGFWIVTANRISLTDMTIKESRSDGVYIGSTTSPFDAATISTDIIIANNKIINCGRNGITVEGAKRYSISGNIISGTNGYAPQAGIDVEPNTTFAGNWGSVDGVISNNIIDDNYGAGLSVYRSSSLIVSGNSINNSGGSGLALLGDLYNVSLIGNSIKNAGLRAATNNDLFYGISSTDTAGLTSNLAITGNVVDAARSYNIAIGTGSTALVSANSFSVSAAAATAWGSLGAGTANTNSYFSSYIASTDNGGTTFRDNTYRVTASTATWRGESTFFIGVTKAGIYNNTFYNVNSGLKIRLDGGGGTVPYEFHRNAVLANLSVGQNSAGWWTATDIDFSRSYLNGSKATLITVQSNSPTIGWVMPANTGDTYEFAYGITSVASVKYQRKVWNGTTWQYVSAFNGVYP